MDFVGMHYGSLMLSTASAAHFIIIGLTCFSQSGMALDHHRRSETRVEAPRKSHRKVYGHLSKACLTIIARAYFTVGNNIIRPCCAALYPALVTVMDLPTWTQ